MTQAIFQQIATEIQAKPAQVSAACQLLDEGATVPFIARYRKEITQGLDDTQLRRLERRLHYLRELAQRKQSILASLNEQGHLNKGLQQAILQADSKSLLEDLYQPYKSKRRTKGQMAKEAGLEPLANQLLQQAATLPEDLAEPYLKANSPYSDTKTALEGAKSILMERFAGHATTLHQLRTLLTKQALVSSKVVKGQEQQGQKFRDYFAYSEALAKIPSHRALALLRGKSEKVIKLSLELPDLQPKQAHPAESIIRQAQRLAIQTNPCGKWLSQVISASWRLKLKPQLETELINRLREQAETEAINVFSRNLNDLLMAAPAGAKTTMGLDPGLRTGVKVAVVDATGKLLDTTTIYPHAPRNKWQASLNTLKHFVQQYQVELISIGNGTASRETDKLAVELIAELAPNKLQKIMVSEAGASVYSASELAAEEFPELDVSIRGAVSIARRLQDPLAELVKIDPKSIGVGQYQHDVSQHQLSQQLDTVIEDCVTKVGVDINMASAALLSRVAGLNASIAQNIIKYRDEHGAFSKRSQLKKVTRLGPKAYQQAAGFLRIRHASNGLDSSAVHPEAYPAAKAIAAACETPIQQLIGNQTLLAKVDPQQFVSAQFGLPTITDIISELQKPGRDPRPEFSTATFKDGVEKISDLQISMLLEGVVTNVTNFGAFVDIGVHQDGLVHISCLAKHFVKDPHQIVKAGDIVRVKVMEIDLSRQRIALSMCLDQPSPTAEPVTAPSPKRHQQQASRSAPPPHSALAEAFNQAKTRR